MTELHQDICSATWWDSKLFNALIHPKLWLETPGDCRMLHQQQPAPFINLMGFIFLTLAIYQAEAVWWGREEDQIPCCLLQLNRETVDSWSLVLFASLFFSAVFSHHSLLLCACFLCSLQASLFILSRYLHFSTSLPVDVFCTPFFTGIPSPTPPTLLFPSLIFLPLLPYFSRPLTAFAFLPLFSLNFTHPSLPSISGLWGRWLPVHH